MTVIIVKRMQLLGTIALDEKIEDSSKLRKRMNFHLKAK